LKSKVSWNSSLIKLPNSGAIFDLDRKIGELKELEKETQDGDFWQDQNKAKAVMQQKDRLERTISSYDKLAEQFRNSKELYELALLEEDQETIAEVVKDIQAIEKKYDALELQTLLHDKDDERNAILTIHPGAGGTESQDWAEMLMRMYLRWTEQQNMKSLVLDFQEGDGAGIKNATINISGENVFGYLKAEAGVHRLVRISPFDSNARRHTSFASVFVVPEIDSDIEIEINPSELRIDTYRASGAGGQHVNTTDSAVRITHLPTGIVTQCQNERSQHQNKETAMKILRARLYHKKIEEEKAALDAKSGEKKEIGWGSQIRSYVFHPYNMVKDHRTGVETSNVNAVMDGNLDAFIHAYLVHQTKKVSE
jgi:peptide chain release factor 2